jgi:hypothetical protein
MIIGIAFAVILALIQPAPKLACNDAIARGKHVKAGVSSVIVRRFLIMVQHNNRAGYFYETNIPPGYFVSFSDRRPKPVWDLNQFLLNYKPPSGIDSRSASPGGIPINRNGPSTIPYENTFIIYPCSG